MEKKLIVLDSDGTLVDSLRFHLNYYNILSRFVNRKFWKDEKEFGNWCDSDYKVNFRRMGISPDLEFVAKALYFVFYHKNKHSIPIHQGVDKVLRVLNETDNHVAILSNNHDDTIRGKLDQFNLLDYVHKIVSYDEPDHLRPKPHPDGLEFLMDHFKVFRENTFFVGDMDIDGLTAAAAKVPFIWSAYGYHSKEKIRGPIIHTLQKPEDLLEVLK